MWTGAGSTEGLDCIADGAAREAGDGELLVEAVAVVVVAL
jgi:hypothetical protein